MRGWMLAGSAVVAGCGAPVALEPRSLPVCEVSEMSPVVPPTGPASPRAALVANIEE